MSAGRRPDLIVPTIEGTSSSAQHPIEPADRAAQLQRLREAGLPVPSSQYSDLESPLIRDDGLPHYVEQREDGTWACMAGCPSCTAAGVYQHGRTGDDMTISATLGQRGECPHCGKEVMRRRNGTLGRHKSRGPVGDPCPGSGLKSSS